MSEIIKETQKHEADENIAKPAPKTAAELSENELENVAGGLIALLRKPGD